MMSEAKTRDLLLQIATHERELTYARACHEILGSDAWKVIETCLVAEQNAEVDRLLDEKDTTSEALGRWKGQMHAIRRLLAIPRFKAGMLAERQRQLDECKRLLQNADRVPGADYEQRVQQVRQQLQEMKR